MPIRDSLPLFTIFKAKLLTLRVPYNTMPLKVIKTKSKIYTKHIKRGTHMQNLKAVIKNLQARNNVLEGNYTDLSFLLLYFFPFFLH